MRGKRLGVITFGPSGGELTDDLRACLPDCEIHEQGLLDGVSEQALDAWRTGPGSAEGTVVHLRDGRELTIASGPLMDRIPLARERLAARSPRVVLYGCAGPIPRAPASDAALSIRPLPLMRAFLAATVPEGRVGIVVPSPLHVEQTRKNYASPGRLVDCRAVSPADRDAVLAAAASLSEDGAAVVMLACFDHTLRDLTAARSALAVPVLSSRQLAIDAVRALLNIAIRLK